MRTSLVAVLAVVGLTGWQVQRVVTLDHYRPVQSAYEDAVQRSRGGENLRRAVAPRQPTPLADAGDLVGVDNARLAEGANASGVEPSYRTAEGANATGVDNARMS